MVESSINTSSGVVGQNLSGGIIQYVPGLLQVGGTVGDYHRVAHVRRQNGDILSEQALKGLSVTFL